MTDTLKEVQKKEAELEKGVERTRETKVFTPAVDIIEKGYYLHDRVIRFARVVVGD